MISRLCAAALFFFGAAWMPALAEGEPGDFDFYVLSLSWSPSYCASPAAKPGDLQCSGVRPYAFVVHGLWPQYERGFPSYCNSSAPRLPQRLINGMLDIMPSPGLVVHEWRTHGTCDGGTAESYFGRARAARQQVTIPPEFIALESYRTVPPIEVERAFLAANPGLKPDMIAIACGRRNLEEVRICMTRDLDFRSCPEVDRGTCRASKVVMPPSRASRR